MDNQETKEPVIDKGLTKTQWDSVCRTLSSDSGWLTVAKLMEEDVAEAEATLYNSTDPARQNALHEAIGFLKFANRLAEIRDRARYVSERGVSPDAAPREPVL